VKGQLAELEADQQNASLTLRPPTIISFANVCCMIRCLDVRKIYRQGENDITALAGVSLDIAKDPCVIMGPSGSGRARCCI